jgi:putative ABC transport system permease protein
VLGASIGNVATLLTVDFVKLVLLAILIAAPIGWVAMNKWLNDYAYRVQISWWMIGLAGMAVIAISIITVSFQAIKAALSNPVKSLRSE